MKSMIEQSAKQSSESGPRKILVLLDNLFFAAKINHAAALTGVQITYAKTHVKALAIALDENPSLVIVDLDAAKCAPLELIAQLKSDDRLRAIPTLGFVSHVNTGLQEEARKAGCDRVLARSAFDRYLVALLEKLP